MSSVGIPFYRLGGYFDFHGPPLVNGFDALVVKRHGTPHGMRPQYISELFLSFFLAIQTYQFFIMLKNSLKNGSLHFHFKIVNITVKIVLGKSFYI